MIHKYQLYIALTDDSDDVHKRKRWDLRTRVFELQNPFIFETEVSGHPTHSQTQIDLSGIGKMNADIVNHGSYTQVNCYPVERVKSHEFDKKVSDCRRCLEELSQAQLEQDCELRVINGTIQAVKREGDKK